MMLVSLRRGFRIGHCSILAPKKCLATLVDSSVGNIAKYALSVKNGGLVAFPTETVYGLGANGLNEASVRKIFAAKKRPLTDPVILHVSKFEEAFDLWKFHPNESKARAVMTTLVSSFWPGPLTIIFRASDIVPSVVTSGSGFVGIRCPHHPIARQLIERAEVPIAAPSANKFGHVSPTSAKHVYDDLVSEDVVILEDNGHSNIGIESTVCRVSSCGSNIEILRNGAISSAQILESLKNNNNMDVNVLCRKKYQTIDPQGNVSPGNLVKHYAPDVPTFIVSVDYLNSILNSTNTSKDKERLEERFSKTFVIDFHGLLGSLRHQVAYYTDISEKGDILEAYRQLYDTLRRTENSILYQEVLVPNLEDMAERDEQVNALWERFHRAASGNHFSL